MNIRDITLFCLPILFALQCIKTVSDDNSLLIPSTKAADIYWSSISFDSQLKNVSTDRVYQVTFNDTYDNQPSFHPGGNSIYFSSKCFPDTTQADIYEYFFDTKSTHQITATPESEFSPVVIPESQFISVVRVELDASQQFWQCGLNGANFLPIFNSLRNMGYYGWCSTQKVAFCVVNNELDSNGIPVFTLEVATRGLESLKKLCKNVGFCFQKVPSENSMAFIQKVTAEEWWIKKFDCITDTIIPLFKTVPRSNYFVISQDGTFLMAQKLILYKLSPQIDTAWQIVHDFSVDGIPRQLEITRLALSPDNTKLAFVLSP